MEWTSLNDLRSKFLKFFESKGHLCLPSFPLVPQGDKSLLLIVAGMAPLKKYFTGEATPPRTRIATCQKCIRTNDIERVGVTARHGSYFEMLGNFSFGDYFKKEAIPWAWEFLTKTLEIPEEKLWPSIYEKDDESFEIWRSIGVPAEKIVRLGKDDNFWELGEGPCGPCTEIYFDRGEKYGCGKPDCKPGCDCDRYMEIWNNVFSQYSNDGKGNYTELKHKNIDTGMGLERLACVMQGVDNMFEVDTIRHILDHVCTIAGKKYGENKKDDISIRVITDHIRGASFMICDTVLPSNEGRGYILRRIIRRAARHGRLLGIRRPFMEELCDTVIKENGSAYPELIERADYIKKVLSVEEERFLTTLDSGLNILNGIMDASSGALSGDDAFKLSDTFGFPIDLTKEIAAERGLSVDMDRYEELLTAQKDRARAARAAGEGWKGVLGHKLKTASTEFVGYDVTECRSKVLELIVDGESVESVSEGEFAVVLDRTPFYAESGGQVGDKGTISAGTFSAEVVDTKKNPAGVFIHDCQLTDGQISVGDEVTASVDAERRLAIRRNHSSVHLLQAALREVLGAHVAQAGSYVDDSRSRFDFTHFSAVTKEELAKVEDIVNSHILEGIPVTTEVMDTESAKKSGATALFDEKYGDFVRVVSMGDVSKEFCGGTHIDNTARIGYYRIISESSVAAGVRRIEAASGKAALQLAREDRELLSEVASVMKVQTEKDICRRADELGSEIKTLKNEAASLGEKLARAQINEALSSAGDIKGLKVLTAKISSLPVDAVRAVGDDLKANHPEIVAVIAVESGDKLNFVCVCGQDAIKAGVKAGALASLVGKITGGGGGGRPDCAVSGGKDLSKTDEALAAVKESI